MTAQDRAEVPTGDVQAGVGPEVRPADEQTSARVLDLTSDEYHADPCQEPSLNSSTARILLTRTPAHAKAQHPRLWDEPPPPKESRAMDVGTAVHQLLLRDDRIDVVERERWDTNEVKAEVADIRARGRIPMKRSTWNAATALADKIRERMYEIEDPRPFTQGTPEATIVWQEDDVWCRARLDWLREDLATVDDLKTTSRESGADPRNAERQVWSYGYDLQAAFYVRGVEALYGVRPRWRWVFAETYPPYAVSVLELDDEAMLAAQVKVDEAIRLWRECLTNDSWPAYPLESFTVSQPGWVLARNDRWAEVDMDEGVPF